MLKFYTGCLLYVTVIIFEFHTVKSFSFRCFFLHYSSFEMLTRLSEVLSIEILSTWCDLKTVAKVDSAFCNKDDRWVFQHLLNNPTFGSSDSTYQSSKSFWCWIMAKGIKLQHMKGLFCEVMSSAKFLDKVDCSEVIEFNMDSLKRLKSVVELINKSVCMKILEISTSIYWQEPSICETSQLYHISNQILSQLTVLSIRHKHGKILPFNLSDIAITCTQLCRLSLDCDDYSSVSENTMIQTIQNNTHLQYLTVNNCIGYETALMTAIGLNCVELQSLLIADIYMESCSIESIYALLINCKQLTYCNLNGGGLYFSAIGTCGLLEISVSKSDFPFLPVLNVHCNKISKLALSVWDIDGSFIPQITLKCPQLTELCVGRSWHAYPVDTLRCIVTRCTKLETLSLWYVRATFDEMVSIFCSNQVLGLKSVTVLTVPPHPDLSEYIKKHNPSIVSCTTVQGE